MHRHPFFYHSLMHASIGPLKRWVEQPTDADFADLRSRTVLDFGCGTGNNCELFDRDHYLGVDIDQDRVNYARKQYPMHQFFAKGTPEEVAELSFDYVFISGVLHHIPDEIVRQYLRMFAEQLPADGGIVVCEPCLFPGSVFNPIMTRWDDGECIRDEAGYLDLFADYQTEVVSKFRHHLIYNRILFTAKPHA